MSIWLEVSRIESYPSTSDMEDSFSDDNDQKIYNEVIRLITLKRKEIPKTTDTLKPSANKKSLSPSADDQIEDLIDLSDASVQQTPKKLPPMVPKKPTKLKGQNMTRKPPPPPPPPPSRNRGNTLTHSYTDSVMLSPHSTTQSLLPTSPHLLPTLLRMVTLSTKNYHRYLLDDKLPSINSSTSHNSELDSICNSPGFIELEEYDQKVLIGLNELYPRFINWKMLTRNSTFSKMTTMLSSRVLVSN